MFSKILTQKEFMNLWFRTGKDPHGKDIQEIIVGGLENSYLKYLKLEVKSSLQNTIGSKSKLYVWHTMGDGKVRDEHKVRDKGIFNWNLDDDIKPGEDYGCRCYAEFLNDNLKSNGEYGRIAWPEKGTESNPKPHYEPTDKNGKALNQKDWKTLTDKEKELRKQEELEKFKNSDKLRDNIRKAKNNRFRIIWFYNQVKSGGPWDYKYGGHPEMEHVGNFNYGATGTAVGFSKEFLERMAGRQQQNGPNYDESFGDWRDNLIYENNPNTSYGDDPIDQYYINMGIDWYNNNY